jgi:hypothetical protein
MWRAQFCRNLLAIERLGAVHGIDGGHDPARDHWLGNRRIGHEGLHTGAGSASPLVSITIRVNGTMAVGPALATALAASIADPRAFRSGRTSRRGSGSSP